MQGNGLQHKRVVVLGGSSGIGLAGGRAGGVAGSERHYRLQ